MTYPTEPQHAQASALQTYDNSTTSGNPGFDSAGEATGVRSIRAPEPLIRFSVFDGPISNTTPRQQVSCNTWAEFPAAYFGAFGLQPGQLGVVQVPGLEALIATKPTPEQLRKFLKPVKEASSYWTALPCERRSKQHMGSSATIVLDHDDLTNQRFTSLVAALQAYAFLVHGSFSHLASVAAHGIGKLRVILPLSREVTPAEYEKIWPHVNTLLGGGADPACKDASRAYFGPFVTQLESEGLQVRWQDGTRIDVDALLNSPPPASAGLLTTALQGISRTSKSLAEHVQAVRSAPGGNKHGTLVEASYAHACAAHEAHEPREQAQARVLDLLLGALRENPSEVADWSVAHKTIVSAFNKAYARTLPAVGELALAPYAGWLPKEASEFTDAGFALRFVITCREHAIFVPGQSWFRWDGRRWARSTRPTDLIAAMLHALQAELEKQAGVTDASAGEQRDPQELAKLIKSMRSAGKLSAIVRLAEELSAAQVPFARLDADPYLLNVANGTIDLRTGELRAHDPANLITKLAPVDYDRHAQCPQWREALNTYSCGDAKWINYVQWILGRGLVGEVRTEIIPLFTGRGGNGKGTTLRTVADVLGDYAGVLPASAMTKGAHTSAWGGLIGKRFVRSPEIDTKTPLAMSTLKAMCSYEGVRAQTGMGENFVDMTPSWQLIAIVNGTARVTGRDDADTRRLRVIPWRAELDLKISGKVRLDKELVSREGPGILAWLVAGAMMPLTEPECRAVADATRDMFDANDPVQDWIESCCEIGADFNATPQDLYRSYSGFADPRDRLGSKSFGDALDERGFRRAKSNGARLHCGLQLKGRLPAVRPMFSSS